MDHLAALEGACRARDGVDHALRLEPGSPTIERWVDGSLVGALAIQEGSPPELGLLVHPEHRRRGIGRGLVDEAAARCRDQGATELLLTTEGRSASGRAFAEALGAREVLSEYAMQLATPPPDRGDWSPPLTIRKLNPTEADTFETIRASAYGDPSTDATRARLAARIADPRNELRIADLDGRPVATIRIARYDDSIYLAAFAVLKELQGRGIGRQLLTRTVRELAGDRRPIMLEVTTENANALGLYRSCGFRETNVYAYYALPL